MSIFIRALKVIDHDGGMFELQIPDQPLTSDQQKVLETLFPNFGEQVYQLLQREALIDAVMTPAEITHHRERNEKTDSKYSEKTSLKKVAVSP